MLSAANTYSIFTWETAGAAAAVSANLATEEATRASADTAINTQLASKADLVSGKVPVSQLPGFVTDVLEFANLAAFPGTGDAAKLYVAIDTGKIYRWSGSAYTVISDTPDLASQPQAEAGTDNATLMTPLRVAQAIAALTLHRATGVLRGYTSPGSTGSPASFTLDYATYDGVDWKITIDGTDYGQGHTSSGAIPGAPLNLPAGWTVTESGTVRTVTRDTNGAHTVTVTVIDVSPSITSFTDGDNAATAAVAVLNFAPYNGNYFSLILDGADAGASIGPPHVAPGGVNSGTWVYAVTSSTTGTVTAPDFASGHTCSISAPSNAPVFTLVDSGANDLPPSGNVSEVQLVAVASGKTTKPGGIGLITADGLHTTWAISLKTAGPTYADIITGSTVMAGINMMLAPSPSEFAGYFAGVANASLVARITGTVPLGGSLTLWTETTTQV